MAIMKLEDGYGYGSTSHTSSSYDLEATQTAEWHVDHDEYKNQK